MSKIERGQIWIVVNTAHWSPLALGDWVRILRHTESNVHVRWNPKSKSRSITCLPEQRFRRLFKLSESSTVSNILTHYND